MRILVKLAGGKDQAPGDARFGARRAAVRLDPLFEVLPGTEALGAADSPPATWYVAEAKDADGFGAGSAHPWDVAHTVLHDGLGLDGPNVLAVEPDLDQDWTWPGDGAPFLRAREADEAPDGEKGYPFDKGGEFGWHLNRDHSGLADARAGVTEAAQQAITIVHLDTGYDPDHLALPVNLDHGREKNFVENFVETNASNAQDRTPSTGLLRNRGHGTGTLGILAGGSAGGLESGLSVCL